MGLNAWRMIRQGNFWDALYDVGFWYFILAGLIIALLGVKWGPYLALAGALGVLCTAGRAKKNIVGRFFSGLYSLYSVTGYLSDVLSYSRLMALGISTGVVSSVVNTLCALVGNNFIGWIFFVIVFIGGHTFNLLINLLGAFVHTSRLQFVEFFGKFYQSGGRSFSPLQNITKYVKIIKEEI
jgi:V/A-type H+-transporting ATPase subunit I